jgi:hypothetical protein
MDSLTDREKSLLPMREMVLLSMSDDTDRIENTHIEYYYPKHFLHDCLDKIVSYSVTNNILDISETC